MRVNLIIGIGVLLACTASNAHAQEATTVTLGRPEPLMLGRPQPIAQAGFVPIAAQTPENSEAPRVVRGQAPPQPPPFLGAGPAPLGPEAYNNGVVNNDADLGGFFSRVGDKLKRCFSDVGSSVQAGPSRGLFQSDREFEVFTSPVTNPYFFMDPRASTEFRPVFIWQHLPSANPNWNGGNRYDLAATGSVAFTPYLSLVINRLGLTSDHPRGNDPVIQSSTGFSEFMFGPKVTFLRSETSNTVAAFGLTLDFPAGAANVQQNTGHLMLIPYFSIAQNFGKNQYGSFNFMNTTGYTFRTDNTRTEALFSSFHLDFEVAKKFFPLVELNWRHYARNGGMQNFNFEGNDLTNYGSRTISGFNDLNLAVGMRYRFNNNIEFGIAGEFNILPNSGGRHLDAFRLTTDLIFRY